MRALPRVRSLIPLRLDVSYEVAVGLVDIAGNGVVCSDDSLNCVPVISATYERMDAYSPPLIVDNGSLQRRASELVVETDPIGGSRKTQRKVFTPAVPLKLAEIYGQFDVAGRPSGAAWRAIDEFRGSVTDALNASQDETGHIHYTPDPGIEAFFFEVVAGWPYAQDPLTLTVQGKWPRLRPWTVVARPALEPPDAARSGARLNAYKIERNDEEQILTITVPRGARVTAQMRSRGRSDKIHALFRYVVNQLGHEEQIISKQVREQRHDVTNPSATLVITHATQLPDLAPNLYSASLTRTADDSTVKFKAIISADGATTGSVDLLASWEDWVEPTSVGQSPTKRVKPPVTLGTKIIAPSSTINDQEELDGVFDFHDKSYHDLTISLRANARFASYFPDSPPKSTTSSTTLKKAALSTTTPPRPGLMYAVPNFITIDNPGKPVGAYVGFTRTRLGGVRLLFRPGWWATGNGELLGVVIGTNSDPNAGESAGDYVTTVGLDPIFSGEDTLNADLLRADFAFAVGDAVDLTVPIPDPTNPDKISTKIKATVVPHAIIYDGTRNLWYSDISIRKTYLEAYGYRAMFAVAVVRYQPNTISEGAPPPFCVSPPERTFFIQTFADSMISLTFALGFETVKVQFTYTSPQRPLSRTDRHGESYGIELKAAREMRQWNVYGALTWAEAEPLALEPVEPGVYAGSFTTSIDDFLNSRLTVDEHEIMPKEVRPPSGEQMSPTTDGRRFSMITSVEMELFWNVQLGPKPVHHP